MKAYRIIIPLTIIMTAWSGSILTESGMNWYRSINLPGFTPSGFIIGIVWTTIFVLTGISMIMAREKIDKENHKKLKSLTYSFMANMLLNVLWSYLFFVMYRIGLAVVESFILFLSVLWMIKNVKPISKWSAILLAPYAIWVIFATILTFNIWIINK